MHTPLKLNLPADRTARLRYMRELFPQATGDDLMEFQAGGRTQALHQLNAADARAYAKNRNFLDGANTRLSPYLRHGCITLPETADFIKQKFGMVGENLLMQLAWREYWRQVWYARGDAIFSELEPPKVSIHYQPLSSQIKSAKSGLPCMDGFLNELLKTGYMHNHARMWFASYVIHFLKMDWREAADWFETQLLDGDLASNHLSWQWVASTFSIKPYYFNKDNLARFSGQQYCNGCRASCPFDDSYEALSVRLFERSDTNTAKQHAISTLPKNPASPHEHWAVFVHDEMLSPTHPIMQATFPKIFVFDPLQYHAWPIYRLQFLADCLNEMPEVEVWFGDTYEILLQKSVGNLVTQQTPNSKYKALLSPFNVEWQPESTLTQEPLVEKELRRFSRFWEKIKTSLLHDQRCENSL